MLAFVDYKINKKEFDDNTKTIVGSQTNILNLVRLCFSTPRYIISEYRPNELYTSQWLNFFMDETLRSHKEVDTYIGRALTELIDTNEKILETRIKKETILRIIKDMNFNNKNIYFIDLLKAICICNTRPLFLNQKIITKYLLDPEKFKLACFKFYEADNRIFVMNSKYNFEKPLLDLGANKFTRAERNMRVHNETLGFIC